MSLKTTTRWACDKCNATASEPGKDAPIPEGWGHLTIVNRFAAPPGTKLYFEAVAMAGPEKFHVDDSGDITVLQSEEKHYCEECWNEVSLNL